MDLSQIPAGRNPPKDVNVLIEIPAGGLPVKYEMDKASGALFVDRFLHTAMYSPGNYGFIPRTLSEDGDPTDDLYPFHTDVRSYRDLPDILIKQIEHFFQHYKDLEESKWTKLGNLGGAEDAERLILDAIARAGKAEKILRSVPAWLPEEKHIAIRVGDLETA